MEWEVLEQHFARPSIALSSAIDREIRRREMVRSYQSLVERPDHVYHDLLLPAPYKVYYGGRGAAKDWAFSETLIKRATREAMLVLCTREYQNSVADSVHRILRNTITRLGFESMFKVTDKSIKSLAGTEFIFKGLHHNVEEIKSTEGVKITWVHEAQNTTDDSWDNLLATVFRLEDSEVWVSFNVTDLMSPTYRRFVTNPPKGAIVHMVNYDANPFFPPRLRELMERDRANDPRIYEHIWLGKPRAISNSVILGGRYRIQEFPDDLWKRADRLFFGVDHGFANDPAAIVRNFVLPAQKCRELGFKLENDPSPDAPRLFIEYEAGGTGIEINELPTVFDTIPEVRNWPIKADNARPETISYLHSQGFNISAAEKWKGSVEDGIAHLRRHVIVVHPRCQRTASNCGAWSYKVDRKVIDAETNAPQVLPVVIDGNDDYTDAVRYSHDGYIQKSGSLEQWARLAG
jgi:phage terminase large subunit